MLDFMGQCDLPSAALRGLLPQALRGLLPQALRGRNSDNLAGEQREAVEQMGSEGLVRVNQTIKTKDGINTTIILKFANRG